MSSTPARVKLGSSDLEVSVVCMGTMTMGSMSDENTSIEILDRYIELGGDFIDTAEMYPVPCKPEWVGKSEEIIGRWLKARPGTREKIVIATKVAGPRGPGNAAKAVANREKTLTGSATAEDADKGCDLSREQIRRACDASLKRLGIDCIDLYQVHWPERYVPKWGAYQYSAAKEAEDAHHRLVGVEAVCTAMAELVREGKIKHWGLSNETSFGVCSFMEACKRLSLPPPITIQNDFGLLYRVFEGELAETCSRAHHNVSLLAYGVLNGGFLSGKYIRGDAEKTARFNFDQKFQPRYFHGPAAEATKEYMALAAECGMDCATLAQAWAYSRSYMGAVIIGATSLAQLEANWKAATTTLSDDTLAKIDAIHVKRRNPNLTD